MTNPPRMRGELPFPDAGEGIVLRFTNPDCELLQKDFGDNWFLDAAQKCNRSDMKFIRTCYELGAKKDGKPARLKMDELDMPIADIGTAVLDALFLAVMGRSFMDHLAYLDEKALASPTNVGAPDDPNQ